jgi:hypothetical protein
MASGLDTIFMSVWQRTRRHLASGDDLIFASMPKSASQYLERLILAGLGDHWQSVRGKYTNGGSQMFQSAAVMMRKVPLRRRALCYGHMLYCDHNRRVWQRTIVTKRAIVSIRNLPDALLSYRDHVDTHGYGPLDLRVGREHAEGFSCWSHLSRSEKNDYLVYFIAPWYFTFLDGWLAAREAGWRIELVRFEELIANPTNVTLHALSKLGLSGETTRVIKASETKRNFNRGTTGRGSGEFCPEHFEHLRRLAGLRNNILGEPGLVDYLIDCSNVRAAEADDAQSDFHRVQNSEYPPEGA